jgi:hypothetical protein
MNGFLRLTKGEKDLTTRQSFSGPIEITVVARAEKNNIRLRMGKGACVIFNWEANPSELRITRSDGTERPESGSLATAPTPPLEPNIWYTLRWRINAKGMLVTVDGATVYVETHANDLSEKHPVRIHASDSDVDVKSFWVRPIRRKSG